jgi:transposase
MSKSYLLIFITSAYMEDRQCLIAELGYSRGHRAGLEQIVIVPMVTPQGPPSYWKVLDGILITSPPLPGVVNNLKQRFGLKTCHLVFERWMVSGDHLDLLEAQRLTYLSRYG